jgi:hypothetical protein
MHLGDAIEKTLRGIRDRDGKKYFNEVADTLLNGIAISIHNKAGLQALRRAIGRLEDYVNWAEENSHLWRRNQPAKPSITA